MRGNPETKRAAISSPLPSIRARADQNCIARPRTKPERRVVGARVVAVPAGSSTTLPAVPCRRRVVDARRKFAAARANMNSSSPHRRKRSHPKQCVPDAAAGRRQLSPGSALPELRPPRLIQRMCSTPASQVAPVPAQLHGWSASREWRLPHDFGLPTGSAVRGGCRPGPTALGTSMLRVDRMHALSQLATFPGPSQLYGGRYMVVMNRVVEVGRRLQVAARSRIAHEARAGDAGDAAVVAAVEQVPISGAGSRPRPCRREVIGARVQLLRRQVSARDGLHPRRAVVLRLLRDSRLGLPPVRW